jgi:hypothetical protein
MPASLINLDGARCWCPLCDKQHRRIGAVAPWIGPGGVRVCTYVVCLDCYHNTLPLSDADKRAAVDRVERTLLNRHPNLRARLPAGYEPKG